MNIVGINGIILASTILCVTLKRHIPEYSLVINITTGILVILMILSSISSILTNIQNLLSYAKIPNEYCVIILKSLGICFISQFTSDSCADAGEKAMASRIEFAGKVAMIISALPLFEKLTQTALELVGAK